jgi:hypothetical protein
MPMPPSRRLPLKAEKHTVTPDTDLISRPFDAAFGKLVENRARNPRVKTKAPLHTGPDSHIGTQIISVRGAPHDKLVARSQNNVVINIAPQSDHLIPTAALIFSGNDYERHVIHVDPTTFHWRDKPVAAIRLAPQYTGKELYQRRPTYKATFMIPATVSGNPDVEFLRRGLSNAPQNVPTPALRGELVRGELVRGLLAFGLSVHLRSLA